MSARITAAEATTILRDLARGREDGNGGDVWPLYDRAEDAMAAVVALDDELVAERTRADAAEQERDALRTEVARLRAAVEGRDTAPTDAELEAHEAAGGSWLYRGPGGSLGGRKYARGTSGEPEGGGLPILVRSTRRSAELGEPLGRWWALDANGTPCPWPTPALDAAREGR